MNTYMGVNWSATTRAMVTRRLTTKIGLEALLLHSRYPCLQKGLTCKAVQVTLESIFGQYIKIMVNRFSLFGIMKSLFLMQNYSSSINCL